MNTGTVVITTFQLLVVMALVIPSLASRKTIPAIFRWGIGVMVWVLTLGVVYLGVRENGAGYFSSWQYALTGGTFVLSIMGILFVWHKGRPQEKLSDTSIRSESPAMKFYELIGRPLRALSELAKHAQPGALQLHLLIIAASVVVIGLHRFELISDKGSLRGIVTVTFLLGLGVLSYMSRRIWKRTNNDTAANSDSAGKSNE